MAVDECPVDQCVTPEIRYDWMRTGSLSLDKNMSEIVGSADLFF